MIQHPRHQNKKLPLSIAVLLTLLAPTIFGQGWQVVNFPKIDNLTGVVFSSPDTGYVVTSNGEIARTVDAGKNWGGVQLAKVALEDVFFVAPSSLYVCGAKGKMFKSDNGGRDWINISYYDTTVTFVSIRELGFQVLVATGLTSDSTRRNVGVLARSSTDGSGWALQAVEGLGFGELYSNGNSARFCSWGKMFTTTDAGSHWEGSKLPDGKPSRMLDMKGNTGIMVGNFGQVAYSDDKGKTWHQVTIPKEESHFTSALLLNTNEGYIAGADSKMYHTTDGGKTWNRETLPITCNVHGLAKAGNRLWAIGNKGSMMYKSLK